MEEYLVWSQKVRGHLNIILTPLNYFQDEECGEEGPRHPGEDRWKVSGWKVLGIQSRQLIETEHLQSKKCLHSCCFYLFCCFSQWDLSAIGWMNLGVLKWVTVHWGEGGEEHSISSYVANLGSLSAVSIHRSGVHLWSLATVPTNSMKSAITCKNSRDGRVSVQEEGVCKVLEFFLKILFGILMTCFSLKNMAMDCTIS